MPDPGELGLFILDLDGTLVKHGTTEWLAGATELLDGLQERGYEVAFVTRRGDREFAGHPVYGEGPTRLMLTQAGLGPNRIWFNCRSPRFIVDDSWSQAIYKDTDRPVMFKEMLKLIDEVDAKRP